MNAMIEGLAPSVPVSLHWLASDNPIEPVMTRSFSVMPSLTRDLGRFTIQRVTTGTQPHRAEYVSSYDTIMVFDDGSFVEGERWIDGVCRRSSGPLNQGIDIVPANHRFQAMALPGSNIAGTLIQVERGDAAAVGVSRSSISPVLDLKGDFLNAVACQLRQAIQEEDDAGYLEALIQLLLKEIPRTMDSACHGSRGKQNGGLAPRAKKFAKDFLHNNLDREVDLKELAELVGLSRYHFTREFKTSFGLPPHQYLLRLRVQKACDMLLNSGMSITDVALEVGFSCSSDFSRTFKKIMSMTPREFRLSGLVPQHTCLAD